MFLKTHTYVWPDDSISIRQNTAEADRAAISVQDGYQVESEIDLTEDRLRELRDLIGTYLTDKAGQAATPPAPDAPHPAPLTDDAPDAIDGMTPFELALALRFIAGYDPQVFARAVERVERHRAMLAKGV